jgi:putative signal transducing protein
VSADDLRTIATYINYIEAELAESALDAAGIDAMIRADDCGGVRPHMWMGGVQLIVRDEDVERAREILDNEPRLVEPQELPRES